MTSAEKEVNEWLDSLPANWRFTHFLKSPTLIEDMNIISKTEVLIKMLDIHLTDPEPGINELPAALYDALFDNKGERKTMRYDAVDLFKHVPLAQCLLLVCNRKFLYHPKKFPSYTTIQTD